ncbi:F-box protein CPR1-like [Papaver somniferum]|uniref:F-box protein CPR1-like n=1 Tax=Papaver somniferum TaxID=3469 RepID=UPI000E6F5564|nr:F-box protein CPR1-like [Papaver somniferum]
MPYYFPRGVTPGVVVNGDLHWCADHRAGEYYEAIISFDTTNEISTEVAKLEGPMVHPVDSDSDTVTYLDTNGDTYLVDDSDFNTNDVGVLGGCLCVLHKTHGISVDIWVMQQYGVKESWTKRFTITQKFITKTSHLRVVCEFQDNEILFETDEYLVYYDPKHNTAKKLRTRGAKMSCGAEKYVSTLASLGSGTYC